MLSRSVTSSRIYSFEPGHDLRTGALSFSTEPVPAQVTQIRGQHEGTSFGHKSPTWNMGHGVLCSWPVLSGPCPRYTERLWNHINPGPVLLSHKMQLRDSGKVKKKFEREKGRKFGLFEAWAFNRIFHCISMQRSCSVARYTDLFTRDKEGTSIL